MSVRAKFKVTEKEVDEHGCGDVRLEAVTSGSPENDEFFKWTPSGESDRDWETPFKSS